jgi:hypothetical protein
MSVGPGGMLEFVASAPRPPGPTFSPLSGVQARCIHPDWRDWYVAFKYSRALRSDSTNELTAFYQDEKVEKVCMRCSNAIAQSFKKSAQRHACPALAREVFCQFTFELFSNRSIPPSCSSTIRTAKCG